jgi:hypothetical protein
VVLTGQFLERPALIPCGPLVLEGLAHRGARRPALLICPPLGPGGGMDAPLVAELAWASARAGHPSLRFQHRGVGGSQGAADDRRASEDAVAAFDHLAASVRGGLAVAGVGAGCATALALCGARPLQALLLLAPASLPAAGPRAVPTLVVVPERGGLSPRDLAARLTAGRARVEVVEGADASFRSGLAAAARAATSWLEALSAGPGAR